MKRYLYTFALIIFFNACRKAELPVPKHDPGSVTSATVNMDANYQWQIYYDLKNNMVAGKNLKTSWDIGFNASPDGFQVILNTSKSMLAYNTGSADFSGMPDTNGMAANLHWDEPTGNIDSTAIGDWRIQKNVYIIDKGYDEKGKHLGYHKLRMLDVNETAYTIRIADLNGNGDTTLHITKDSSYNFQFISLPGRNLVIAEPPKDKWDVMFTQFTHVFYNLDPPQPYQVTGCLLNRYHTQAIMDSSLAFQEITYDYALTKTLSPAINSIGYAWKVYSGGTYVINYKMNYIIRTQNAMYYKLYFTDFYDSDGIKGNPAWEFQQL